MREFRIVGVVVQFRDVRYGVSPGEDFLSPQINYTEHLVAPEIIQLIIDGSESDLIQFVDERRTVRFDGDAPVLRQSPQRNGHEVILQIPGLADDPLIHPLDQMLREQNCFVHKDDIPAL